jgi:hypothetical protein
MRPPLILCTFALASCTAPDTDRVQVEADVEARRAVVQTVERLFDGLRTRDTSSLADIIDPGARFVSVRDAEGTLTVRRTDVHEFLASLASAEDTLIERMWDPEVRLDRDVATLWAPYDFYRGSVFSHCGYDAFQLVRDGERWRIVAITYTVRSTPCDSSPARRNVM